jgi:hypothetical protein
MEYQIAIPSYKRSAVLKSATLATLERYDVDPDRVTIFVANDLEMESYRATLGDKWRIVVAKLGKVEAQKFYHNYYQTGTRLLNVDDDIYDIRQRNAQDKLEPFTGTLDQLVREAFTLCETSGAKMWGINPVNNGYFMKDYSVIGLRYICGNFYGNYAGDPAIIGADRPSSISSGDDYETTFRSYLQNGSVVRVEYLTPITKYFAPGGIDAELKDRGVTNRQDEHDAELRAIIDRYPNLASLQIKSGGITNIRVKTQTFAKVTRK